MFSVRLKVSPPVTIQFKIKDNYVSCKFLVNTFLPPKISWYHSPLGWYDSLHFTHSLYFPYNIYSWNTKPFFQALFYNRFRCFGGAMWCLAMPSKTGVRCVPDRNLTCLVAARYPAGPVIQQASGGGLWPHFYFLNCDAIFNAFL